MRCADTTWCFGKECQTPSTWRRHVASHPSQKKYPITTPITGAGYLYSSCFPSLNYACKVSPVKRLKLRDILHVFVRLHPAKLALVPSCSKSIVSAITHNCLSKRWWRNAGRVRIRWPKREESAVKTSSIKCKTPLSSRPNSNLVSAMIMPGRCVVCCFRVELKY